MNSKLMPTPAALRRLLQRSLIAVVLVLSVVGPVGIPTARATNSHQAEINATKQEIAMVKTELEAARAELRELQAEKPTPPATGASLAETKAFNVALAKWQQKVDALKVRITNLQNRLKELEQRLRTLGGQKTESSSPPAK